MIYKDRDAHKDNALSPGCRDKEDCLHCGEHWGSHEGWACPEWSHEHGHSTFKGVPEHQRYLTQSMKDSVPQQSIKQILQEKLGSARPTKTDISDWRAWAHNRPGECGCGIAKVDCIYHKGT